MSARGGIAFRAERAQGLTDGAERGVAVEQLKDRRAEDHTTRVQSRVAYRRQLWTGTATYCHWVIEDHKADWWC